MELQFHKSNVPCLKQIMEEIRDQELTQEVKLTDGMPDIGSVIAGWGQVLLRGKEWHNDRVGITGGVQVWILYAPEDGTNPRTVETWIPFQLQWEIPEGMPDGKLCVMPALRLVDARSVSARKLMVRAAVSLLVKALVPDEAQVCSPGEIPEDVQLQVKEYPVLIPTEAGEKAFVMDEELTVPGDLPKPEKLIRYSLQPQISEAKVMAGKLVFRGGAHLHVLYCGEEGIHTLNMEIPFAQYAELEHEYDPEAVAWVYPAVTSLELELGEEGRLRLKAGLTGQYIVCDRRILSLTEDAYSTQRELEATRESLKLPLVLEDRQWQMQAQCPWNGEGRVADIVFYPDHPRQNRNGDRMEHQLTGKFQILYYDEEGVLRGGSCKWENTVSMEADEHSAVSMYANPVGQPDMDGSQLNLQAVTMAEQGMEAICGMELGDMAQKDPNRPSLILRRAGGESLWQIAKKHGSTISQIQKANRLEAEPEPAAMLMIPIL